MRNSPCTSGLVGLALALGIPGSAGLAQVNASLAIEPWRETPHWADTYDDLLFFARDSSEGAKTFWWDSVGKIKFFREDSDPDYAIGYKILTLDIDADNRLIDGQFNDVAVVGMGRLPVDLGEDLDLRLVGGLGTANDGHFSDGDAIYGLATIDFEKQNADGSSWNLGISYDGNADLFPDVPLPYGTYSARVGEDLHYKLGLPESSIFYRPLERLSLLLSYEFPLEASVVASFEVFDGVSLFGQYRRDFDGFHLDEFDNRRVFYEFDRLSLGLRWITKWVDVSVGGGFAVHQEFRSGFDIRDTERVADLSDEPFLFFTVQGPI